MVRNTLAITAIAVAGVSMPASAAVRITEWLYDSQEFIEITNTGATPVDLTGWSFSDSAATPGSFDLSGFGTLGAGEAAIISQNPADTFRTYWGLSNDVKVLGNNTIYNLQRGDEINIYDADDTLVDRLTYADNGSAGGPRTNNASGNTAPANYGLNNATLWELASVGDVYGSFAAPGNSSIVANPGVSVLVPEPASLALIGLAGLLGRRRRA